MSHWGLRKKGIEPLYPDEWNTVLDALDQLWGTGESSVKYYDLQALGYDIIPDADAKRSLGAQGRAWLDIYGYYGFFNANVFVQGKPVIKDGDPITISDLGDSAVSKITQAVSSGTSVATQYLGKIWDKWSRVSIDQYGNIGVVVAGGGAGGPVTGTVTVGDLGDSAVAKVTGAVNNATVTSDASRIRGKVELQRLDPRGYVKTSRRARFERSDEVVGAVELEGSVPLNAGFPDVGDYLYIDPNSVAAFKNLDVESEVRVDGKLIAKAIAVGGKLIVNGAVELD